MNRPPRKPNDRERGEQDSPLERQIFKALLESGQIIPETEDEVRAAELRMQKGSRPLPEKLRSAQTVLAQIKSDEETRHSNKIVPLPPSQFAELPQDLARAARKGSDIPPEIEEKMRRNRKKADEGLI